MPTLLALLCLAAADEVGVSAESGDTLFAEGTALSLAWFHYRKTKVYHGSHKVGDAPDEEHADLLIASALYAIDVDTNLGLVVPYESNEEMAGLADSTIFFKRRLYYDSDTDGGWAFTTALAVALQLPTGDSHEAGVDPERRLGSGSWDPFAGLAATVEVGRVFSSAYANTQLNTRGTDAFKHGDILVAGFLAGWRPWMEKYPGPMLVLETGLTWEHESVATDHGERVDDSGSDVLFVPFRAMFSPRSGYNFSAGLDLPVYRRYRGDQLATDYRLTLGFSCVF